MDNAELAVRIADAVHELVLGQFGDDLEHLDDLSIRMVILSGLGEVSVWLIASIVDPAIREQVVRVWATALREGVQAEVARRIPSTIC